MGFERQFDKERERERERLVERHKECRKNAEKISKRKNRVYNVSVDLKGRPNKVVNNGWGGKERKKKVLHQNICKQRVKNVFKILFNS